MDLPDLQSHWNELGIRDPLWAVVTSPEFRGGRWDAVEFFRRGEVEVAEMFEDLAALGISPRRRLALDFGCGVGRLTQPLCRRFLRVHGVDIAPSMLTAARRFNRHPLRCRYLLNAAEDLSALPSDRYDFVCSVIVLQHMQPRLAEAYLRELVRVLAPGGTLVFQLPSEPIGDAASDPSPAARAAPAPEPAAIAARPRSPGRVDRRRLAPVSPSPSWLARLLARLSTEPPTPDVPRIREPAMEMYGIPFERVVELAAAAGAAVLDAADDPWAGPEWRSFRYVAVKDPRRAPMAARPPIRTLAGRSTEPPC